jgi:hypothetical protein
MAANMSTAETACGSTLVTLWVQTSNNRVWHIYSRHGWQFDGATKLVELNG